MTIDDLGADCGSACFREVRGGGGVGEFEREHCVHDPGGVRGQCGKYDPESCLGIPTSIELTRVAPSRSRYPFREFTLPSRGAHQHLRERLDHRE